MPVILITLIVGFLLIIFINRTAVKSFVVQRVNNQLFDLNSLYKKWGEFYNVDPLLIQALARQESDENPNAINLRDPSVGVMQILCKGYPGPCTNRFNIIGWPPNKSENLLDPNFNISLGTQIIKWNLDIFGFPKGIAVYNNWTARFDPQNGPYLNQSYVDSVLVHYRSLGGTLK